MMPGGLPRRSPLALACLLLLLAPPGAAPPPPGLSAGPQLPSPPDLAPAAEQLYGLV